MRSTQVDEYASNRVGFNFMDYYVSNGLFLLVNSFTSQFV
jgi:hypothetical protein